MYRIVDLFIFSSIYKKLFIKKKLFLPETKDSQLMNTLEEGEDFGKGDTAFSWLRKVK